MSDIAKRSVSIPGVFSAFSYVGFLDCVKGFAAILHEKINHFESNLCFGMLVWNVTFVRYGVAWTDLYILFSEN